MTEKDFGIETSIPYRPLTRKEYNILCQRVLCSKAKAISENLNEFITAIDKLNKAITDIDKEFVQLYEALDE